MAKIDLETSNGHMASERVQRMKELPSHEYFQSRRGYALFRVEFVKNGTVFSAWATSPAFESLDAKDSLYQAFSSVQVADVMPHTKLLPWNCESEEQIGELPTSPALLKAPLGSAGDCLYFVNSAMDILTVIKNHKARAEAVPNFLEGLIEKYGAVPSWSLQELFPTLVLNNSRKCQLRAYLVYCGGELYLYADYEIRQPLWEEEDPPKTYQISPLLQVDLDVCQNSTAIPYNHRRSKPSTSRLMLSEVEELQDKHIDERVTALIYKAFHPLKESIQSAAIVEIPDNIPHFSGVEMAVAGLDILLDSSTFEPKIVELNNNPAMPQEGKKMTTRYRNHLLDLVRNIVLLGLDRASEGGELLQERWREVRKKFHQIF